MLNIWSVKSGHSFGSINERVITSITLPTFVGADLTGVTFSVISGKLPGGLRIKDNIILGTSLEVSSTTTSTFVIRAQKDSDIADRTFLITVEGPDAPVWVTAGQDPAVIITDYDQTVTYTAGGVIRKDNTLYLIITEVTGISPPNLSYYTTYILPSGLLPVGPSTIRLSNFIQASRTNNNITIYTTQQHEFIGTNIVTVASADTRVAAANIQLLTPLPDANETEAAYYIRIRNTVTYRKVGNDFTITDIAGTVTLVKEPLTFVLDNTLVDFQLQAIDTDLSSGDSLEYFIADGDGELPPGLTLDTAGRIYGITDPAISLDITARTGTFDSNSYDAYPYDFASAPNIGTIVNAGNFVIGTNYRIETVSTTNYTLVGAVSNAVGIEFSATGSGAGGGTALDLDDVEYLNIIAPNTLNRNYEFIVSVTDGETISKRKFLIYVVGDDFLRTDNTILRLGDGAFAADATYLRSAIWLSASNLGVKRANNYVTISLKALDPTPEIGPLIYTLAEYNPDLTVSKLPTGLYLDSATAEIFGFSPYQPAVTKIFNFTINASKYDKQSITEVAVVIVVADDAVVGQNFLRIFPLPTDDQNLIIGDTIRIGPSLYTVTEYIGESVTGGTMATLRVAENLLTNVIDGLIINKTYSVSDTINAVQVSSKTFTIAMLGKVDSVIGFVTDSDLGSLRPSYTSRLYVEAASSVPNAVLKYTIVDGQLPPGLTLSQAGNIVGKINQFRSSSIAGFTLFDNGTTTFDGGTTTIDRSYKFIVSAEDQFKYSAVSKEFTITVGSADLTLFSNIYTKPFPKQEKRDLFYNFINDTTVFEPNRIYRLGDPEYGMQTDLKMLVYAGIESKEMPEYIAAISKNIKRKRYRMGNIKKAIAKNQGTTDIIYEVIYINVLDDYESAKGAAAARQKLAINLKSPISIDQTNMDVASGALGTVLNGVTTYSSANVQAKLTRLESNRFTPVGGAPMTIDSINHKASGADLEYVYPSSILQVRKNIAEVGTTENDFLPAWMTTPQDNRTAATGFVKAIPLCYCKPGEGTYILENIINRNFDFTQLDFEIDRFIIDSDINDVQEKYLKFNNQKFNI
jgi:hypothetical protein